MSPGVVADSIVNLCGAVGLTVAMMTLYRRDPASPLTRRLLLMLGVIALLFLNRGAAWASGSEFLDSLSVIPAALIPLAALIVTEGILRRHPPRALKMTVLVGAIVLGLGGILGLEWLTTPYAIALSAFQTCRLRPGTDRNLLSYQLKLGLLVALADTPSWERLVLGNRGADCGRGKFDRAGRLATA